MSKVLYEIRLCQIKNSTNSHFTEYQNPDGSGNFIFKEQFWKDIKDNGSILNSYRLVLRVM